MAKQKQKPETFTYDEQEYIVEEMEPEQQTMYFHVKDLQNKLNTNKFMADQLMVGQEAFVKKLTDSLKEVEEAEAEA